MPTPFEGVGSAALAVYGDTVTVTPPGGAAFTVRGILRQSTTEEGVADGRRTWWRWGALRASRASPDIPVGSLVTGGAAPGRVFRVVARIEPSSPATDALVDYDLEVVS